MPRWCPELQIDLPTADTFPKPMSRPARLLSVVFLIGTAIAMPIAAFGVVFSIDPASAYLRTSQDSGVSNALALDLAALGIAPGHVIQILQLGAFKSGEPFADETTFTLGVFSSSAALLAPSAPHRVPGAIASMEPDGDMRHTGLATPGRAVRRQVAGHSHVDVLRLDLPFP